MFAKRRLGSRRILLTGASSGIGLALAHKLASNGAKLLLTARRHARLLKVAHAIEPNAESVEVLAGDITDPHHRSQLVAAAREHFGGLDMLINNAGIGALGTFSSADSDRLRRVMEVNLFAPAELIRACLGLLRQSDDGLVVNIGSVLGHCAVPKKSEYCASKFALHGFTDALRMELRKDGVDVLLVSPSTTQSEFFEHALRSRGRVASNPRSMTAERVAEHVIRAIERRKREVILSPGGKVLVLADRVFPTTLSRILQRFG